MTGLVHDPACAGHLPGRHHPERPERLDSVLCGIAAALPSTPLVPIAARRATDDDLALCHSRDYIRSVVRDIASGSGALSTGDTDVGEGTLEAALAAAGGSLAAVDAVMEQRVRRVFCAVRPPGHHATAERGMGFCVFNNAAIAARHAQRRHGVGRVLIADWDLHHGNGTQDIFYDDPTVFYFSTHQWPCYPGTGAAGETGAGPGRGFTLNCPCAPGSGRREIVGAFREQLVPRMAEFRPELIILSAGFDAMAGDPIGSLALRAEDFAELTAVVAELADRFSLGRIVSVLEGGYSLDGLAAAAGAHVRALAQAPPKQELCAARACQV